jgi:hypothetical protein
MMLAELSNGRAVMNDLKEKRLLRSIRRKIKVLKDLAASREDQSLTVSLHDLGTHAEVVGRHFNYKKNLGWKEKVQKLLASLKLQTTAPR